ncbi:IclR family transcriptional regulator (plasmid) [Haloferax mediterranei ATCC 33500]|uniref:Transcriptional regulator n=1 Tax=Haloferax mediterranei (strain ATCC 33500 / DSM 1411 / JCM 8866 / NBRC 14739 / NCIMB 2177 / R-4) TaxID=523841 RepID=I3RAQ8_HALMT|nr:IclR family transcriptional regulator [Haloferax mediterranei]AFK21318.2 transcription regulator [Haloferax mediterranei ATCC 33500]AHZ24590.1 transcriptional regulator [Haloferax mediterranei ATCC 33500]ELZ97352.1 transcriptional regulator [Haloferax mediterranei ATCC 33500]MDX5990352.1 IclR family transcriptional regulator [Haloferax mediterranei ATCC 33500]QCQ76987.1 IclR family transcriptional regulator [Haloferax mediterranei ATCC 33500]
MTTGNDKTIRSVETAFEILSALGEVEPTGLSDLASVVDIPTSTIYIHLNTLVEQGFVVKEAGQYRRSFRFLEVGGSVRQQLDIARLLRNKVEELSRTTGEIVGAAIEENGKRVILYRSTGEKAAADEIPIGNHTEMHWTSLGKAILAYLPEDRRKQIVERHGLSKGTSQTFTAPQELERELSRVRQQGYAMDDEEHLRGIRGIAVPILDGDENVEASIGVTGPRDRFTPGYMADLLNILRYSKNEIEVRNQYYEYSSIDG